MGPSGDVQPQTFPEKGGQPGQQLCGRKALPAPSAAQTFCVGNLEGGNGETQLPHFCGALNYSVPFEYIKQKVDVRLTRATVEVFYGGNRICSHPRLYGRFSQYSTIQAHMPPEHQKYVQWNGERFIRWAGKVGSNTQVAVQAILSGYKVEQQGYKSCMGLLKLADKYTPEQLENACKRALEYTPRPSLERRPDFIRYLDFSLGQQIVGPAPSLYRPIWMLHGGVALSQMLLVWFG